MNFAMNDGYTLQRKEKTLRGIGLVLSGGGSKGAYEIGVMKALDEMNISGHITGISGSSIGAFNTALFVQRSQETAEYVWRQMTFSDMANINFEKIIDKIRDSDGAGPLEALLKNVHIPETAGKARDILKGRVLGELEEELSRCFLGVSLPEKSKRDEGAMQYGVWLAQNLFGDGFATPDKLLEILKKYVNFGTALQNGMDIYSTVCRWKPDTSFGGEALYIPWRGKSRDELLTLIGASMALPVLYPHAGEGAESSKQQPSNGKSFPRTGEGKERKGEGAGEGAGTRARNADGEYYVDGGYADNIPISPLYRCGYRVILVVYLDKFTGKARDHRIEKERALFPEAEIIRLFPGKEFDYSFLSSCMVSPEKTEEYIRLGYKEALEAFGMIRGKVYG